MLDLSTFLRRERSDFRRKAKKIRRGYYIKNWLEQKKNARLLKDWRDLSSRGDRDQSPLVSVSIATYNRGRILTERTIPSILKQTYDNFEVVIVGDHCTDETPDLIKSIKDPRIKFCNLPERGRYPDTNNPFDRWMVAGVVPRNKSLELCSGDWIATLDDDDELSEDHIEILLKHALSFGYEMVYGKVSIEVAPGVWTELGSYPLREGQISHMSALYSRGLSFFKYHADCWKYEEPADINLWRRMKEAGVKVGFIDKVVGNHYLEGTQRRKWHEK